MRVPGANSMFEGYIPANISDYWKVKDMDLVFELEG